MRNPSVDDDTVDFQPKEEPAAPRGADVPVVGTKAEHLRLEAVVQACPLIEHMEERDGVVTLRLSAAGLARLEDPMIKRNEWKRLEQEAIAVCQQGPKSVVLVFPVNARGLGENTAGLLSALHKHLPRFSAEKRITLHNVPPYFDERLRIHKFDVFLTIAERNPGQTEHVGH